MTKRILSNQRGSNCRKLLGLLELEKKRIEAGGAPVHGVLGPSLLRRNTRQLVWALERGTRRLVLRVLESLLWTQSQLPKQTAPAEVRKHC